VISRTACRGALLRSQIGRLDLLLKSLTTDCHGLASARREIEAIKLQIETKQRSCKTEMSAT
jgi:hypothetical protein